MRTTRWVLAGVVLAGAGWAAGRIARGPARVDIRAFDPDEVARLETAMWRSYYDRRRLPLFGQLVALLRGQFRLSPVPRDRRPAHREQRRQLPRRRRSLRQGRQHGRASRRPA